MLRELRIKFIVLNMAIAVCVIAVAFGAICAFYHSRETSDVSEALSEAIVQTAESARSHGIGGIGSTPFDVPGGTDMGKGTPPEIGGGRSGQQQIPTAGYVLLDDGSLLEVGSANTATISEDVLLEAAATVVAQRDGSGEIPALGLLYELRTVSSVRYVAFADIAEVSGWKTLAITLCGVGLIAIAVFFVISLFFSKWALRPVAQAWEKQTRFVADASHDLKTPLTIILANSSIMRKHPEASVEEMSQWIESTESEAEGMQSLVSDLLFLAQMDEASGTRRAGAHGAAGRGADARASMQPLDFGTLVQREVLQFESIAFERGIVLEDDIAEGISLTGDKAKLKRLVATLLDNACKYVDAHGRVDVSLRRSSDSRFALLIVHNTGPAIAADDLPHVFDRFYRADKARAADTAAAGAGAGAAGAAAGAGAASLQPRKSHGLGLAIAQGIAEEHGGTLSVASTDTAGTTFTAKLPL